MLDVAKWLAEEHVALRYQCSPRHAGSALWPVIQQIGLAADLSSAEVEEALAIAVKGAQTCRRWSKLKDWLGAKPVRAM